jgi:hypothetical protein
LLALSLVTAIALLGAGCTGAPAHPTPTTPPTATTTAIDTPASVPVATFTGCPAPGAAIDMCNATVDIPAWGAGDPDPACPEKAVKLTDGLYPQANGNQANGVQKFVTADVDHDGEPDAIVLLSCQVGDPPSEQVMVVSRSAGGALRTLGQVVGPTHGDIIFVEDVTADPDGSIRALVVHRHGSVGADRALRQWRTYGWKGQQFEQTAGSTSFNADKSVAKLTVTASAVTLGKADGGQRRGTFTLTVKNTGTTTTKEVSVLVDIDIYTFLTVTSKDCPVGTNIKVPTCAVGDLAPGASRGFSVALSIAVDEVDGFKSNVPDGSPGDLRILVGDQAYDSTALPKARFA